MLYDNKFYARTKNSTHTSSEIIVPIVKNLINEPINSVIDFGCGLGNWLKCWQENGASLIKGFETGNISDLQIPIECVEKTNLTLVKKNTEDKFDLAMSLEVAEHLDESYAEEFINTICSYSNKVLFSGAIPHQGGIGHVNEQYPSYWDKYFKNNGYICYDYIRGEIWNNNKVSIWYRQNILLYIKGDTYLKPSKNPLDIIHPYFWNRETQK
jgi:cyclopropane fatty-acyl-phospholipid synthase-like methyltransferase